MTSPEREQILEHQLAPTASKELLDLERKVLAAAFKLSFEGGDSDGAALAHKGLCAIIQQQLFSGDGSSGSVIPASIWQQAALPQADDSAPSEQPTTVASPSAANAAPVAVSDQMDSGETEENADAGEEDPVAAARRLGLTPESRVPTGGPASYLDFGDDGAAAEPEFTMDEFDENAQPSAEAIAEMMQLLDSQPVTEAQPLTPSQLIRKQSFYQILGVDKLSTGQTIHIHYLRLIRKLLRNRAAAEAAGRDMREYREVARAICVAHDVLRDPVTRTDYDLRLLGMRHSTEQIETPADAKPGLGTRTRLMIGELLECANILEPAELQAALDMHKAEPGIQFGEFVVQSGFVTQEILDSTLLAQKLINSGKISVAQFQTAMFRMRNIGTAFFDTLMVEGWIAPSEIFDETSELWQVLGVDLANLLNAAAESPGDEEADATDSAADHAMANASVLHRADEVNAEPLGESSEFRSTEEHAPPSEAPHAVSPEAIVEKIAQAARSGRKVEFDAEWSQDDSLAETQSIDTKALRAVLEARSDETKD